jgi:ribosomal protein S16
MSLLALLIPWTYFGVATVACTTNVITNQTQQASYHVVVRNYCAPRDGRTYLHFLAPLGTVQPAQQDVLPIEFTADGKTQKLTSTMATDQTSEFNFMFSNDNMTQSTWRLWWDAEEGNHGARNQTLLEVTCKIELTDPTGRTIKCWINGSNVDGLSNSFRVDFSNDTFPPIVVQPPQEWQCPEQNKPPENVVNTLSFLPQGQACISNCSILQTDETCCRNAHNTSATCGGDSSPAIKFAAQEAYSFAYDDETPYFNGVSTVRPLRAHNFATGATICEVSLCY